MPNFIIRTVNASMIVESECGDRERSEQALEIGVRGAVEILTDEVERGSKASAVDVSVRDATGQPVQHVVVSLSIAPLMVNDRPSANDR